MMFYKSEPRWVVKRESGPQTCPGPGDYVVDQLGNRYRQIDADQAAALRSQTAGCVYTLMPDGTIR